MVVDMSEDKPELLGMEWLIEEVDKEGSFTAVFNKYRLGLPNLTAKAHNQLHKGMMREVVRKGGKR